MNDCGIKNEGIRFSRGECILRGANGRCLRDDGVRFSHSGVDCKLECNSYKPIVDKVKKLLDAEIERETMTMHPLKNIVKAMVDGDAIIVMSSDDEVIGFIYLKHWDNFIEDSDFVLEIAGLVVEESFRNHGVGVELFSRIISVVDNKYEHKRIIFFANDVSRKLGEKFGFSSQPELLENTEFQELCKGCTKEYRKPKGCRCRVMIKQR